MINEIIFRIKQDKKLYIYLKYHSYWYYILTYDNEKINEMIKEMKIELKETIKTLGVFNVNVKLFEGIIGTLKVQTLAK